MRVRSRMWGRAVVLLLLVVVAAAVARQYGGGITAWTKRIPLYDGKPGVKIGDTCMNPKDHAEMMWVPAGKFTMGTSDGDISRLRKEHSDWKAQFSDEKPQHTVYLSGYWIYKYEVTVKQYREFCKETGSKMPNEPAWGWHDDCPIMNVGWDDASAYAKWAGASLPTEAQWEKAARGTDGRIYPWGNEWDASKCLNNGVEIELGRPVGSYPSGVSPYGCMDMAGSTWEWCKDWYQIDYYSETPSAGWVDPKGPVTISSRVVRGGGWGGAAGDAANVTRCAFRYYFYPPEDWLGTGFRLVR